MGGSNWAPTTPEELIRQMRKDIAQLQRRTDSGGSVPASTTVIPGITRYSTIAETQAGVVSTAAVTPATLAAVTATTARAGLIEVATSAEAIAGIATLLAVDPAGLAAVNLGVLASGLSLTIGGGGIAALLTGRIVLVYGSVADGSGLTMSTSMQTVATLPVGYRPTGNRVFLVPGSAAGTTAAVVQVTTAGFVQVARALGTAATSAQFTGIAFVV